MGLFSKSTGDKVKAPNSTNDWPKHGEYVVKLSKHAFIPMSRRDKQPLAIVEYSVDEVLNPESGNHQGQSCAWICRLEVDRVGDLTELGVMNMGRVKAYTAECLGGSSAGVSFEDVTPEHIANLFGHEIDDDGEEVPIKGWDGTDVAGIKMHLKVVEGVSSKGAKFTNLYWSALPSGD